MPPGYQWGFGRGAGKIEISEESGSSLQSHPDQGPEQLMIRKVQLHPCESGPEVLCPFVLSCNVWSALGTGSSLSMLVEDSPEILAIKF